MKRLRNLRTSAAHRIGIRMAELKECRTLQHLEERFIEVAGRILPGDCLGWNNWEIDWGAPISATINDSYGEWFEQHFDEFSELVGYHPLLASGRFSECAQRVIRLSDFPCGGQFLQNPLYQRIYRHLDSRYQLGYAPARLSDRRIVLSWNRRGLDFSDAEKDQFQLIGRHLAALAKRIEETERLEAVWTELCSFVGKRSQMLPLGHIAASDLHLLTDFARGDSITSIAKAKGIRRDTLSKRVGMLREILGLENQRQLLGALADMRACANGKEALP